MEGSNITIPVAFVAGILSFLSPCVLPLVPGYISLISGVSIDHLKGGSGSRTSALRAVIINSVAFNLGLSVIFLMLGTLAGVVGASITSNPWIRIIGGIVIIAFGLQLMGLLKIAALYKDTRMFSQQKPRGVLGSFTLGMAFAAGWTPCIGPILGGIIGMAAATSTGWRNGLVLSAFYAMGLAVPFLIAGLGINQFMGFYGKFRRHLHKVEVASGILLICIGLLVASGYATRLASQSGLASILPDMEKWFFAKVTPSPSGMESQPGKTQAAAASNSAEAVKSDFPLAPDVALRTSDGKPFRLSDLRGRVVLLNFWATWCIPCRAEIPAFNQMQHEHASRGFEVVGILSNDSEDAFRDFQKEMKQDYTVLFDENNTGAQFGNGPGLPVTVVIDRQGRIRDKLFGGSERRAFEAAVKPLLDEAPATAQNRD